MSMMTCLWLFGLGSLGQSWWHLRFTTLRHAIMWAIVSWIAWGTTLERSTSDDFFLVAFCLTGAAGVAVLGARRPHDRAWNAVVLGLLFVLLLPLAERYIIGAQSSDTLRRMFVAGVLAISVFNYLPTRFGVAAGCVGLAALNHFVTSPTPSFVSTWNQGSGTRLLIFLTPLTAYLAVLATGSGRDRLDPLSRQWLRFRDAYGFVWGQRVREQFNHAAARRSFRTSRLVGALLDYLSHG